MVFQKKRKLRPIGDGIKPIDTAIRPVGRMPKGTGGTQGRVGKPVKPINRRVKGADDIFDVAF